MTMGTAATMMAIAEALGLALPGASSLPAADAGHPRMCAQAGRRIVEMVWDDLMPERILTPAAFQNAIAVHMAMGGSTNAIIHVVAMARRAGIALSLGDFDRISRQVPVIANVRPSGAHLMEDFFYAGGLPALMKLLADRLDGRALTVNGRTVGENIAHAEVFHPDVIRSLDNAIYGEGGTAVLRGNLAPRGAVMKPSAAEPRLRQHRGRAIVFRDYNHMAVEVERDDLDVTPDHVLVLQNAGPKGGPGMPEWGMLPIPRKLVRVGVRDMLRISDARMSAGAGRDRRRDRGGRGAAPPAPARLRRGAGPPPRRLGATAPPLRARLRPHVPGAHRPGRLGLRLRFPGARPAGAGAGDSLSGAPASSGRAGPAAIRGPRRAPRTAPRRRRRRRS
jgi:dihydroxyacid dehydratase/phosphogluconate dehydratase